MSGRYDHIRGLSNPANDDKPMSSHVGNITAKDYQVGDTITYWPFIGPSREVVVTAKRMVKASYSDGQDGEPGFDARMADLADGMTVWGYDYQIAEVRR